MGHQQRTKTIAITGGTAGIGLATAKHFLTEGWQVIITGRNAEKLEQTAEDIAGLFGSSGQLTCHLCDSGQLDQIEQLGNKLQNDEVKLDALILNAGIFKPGIFEETDEALFDHTFDINVKGPFFTLQKLLPVMNNPSSVVLLSSIAVEKTFSGTSAYSASKSAIEGYAQVLNAELAVRGIRINSVRPGITLTEIQEKAGMSQSDIQSLAESMMVTPLGRALEVDDIVPAIHYLATDHSAGMRNAHLKVDGGYCL
ncbi:SDR family NAD(P)-dependent oxidoreductase [Microbulbifer sp. ANSA003]|uniref:SDR family NAD(P)-dependent oxidoreductase n=1 Tax=Microbulbifer sp. ANSA003 TaxID=3243360 RepID=UPI004041C93A